MSDPFEKPFKVFVNELLKVEPEYSYNYEYRRT